MENQAKLDTEWIILMMEAKKMGLSIEEVQKFIKTKGIIKSNLKNYF